MNQDKQLYEAERVWDQDMQLGQRNLAKAISDFVPPDTGTILDVGCGDGKISRQVAHLTGKPVVGLDSSVEALSRCDFKTILGDASALPFSDAEFDLVATIDTFEHLPDNIEAQSFAELFRVAARTVMVAVPFREELQDASARCHACSSTYHVNWHMRSYDWPDLVSRTPAGWKAEAIILTGEAWPAYHSLETQFRRQVLDEWSGWVDAICPHCGAAGTAPDRVSILPPHAAAGLGELIYADLTHRGSIRTHSEIIVMYRRETAPAFVVSPAEARAVQRNACKVQFAEQQLTHDLVPYPEAARPVLSSDGGIVIQFPVYETAEMISIQWDVAPDSPIPFSIQDGLGELLAGQIYPRKDNQTTLAFPRNAVSGYYGLLVYLPRVDSIRSMQIGIGPTGIDLVPRNHQTPEEYHCLELAQHRAYIHAHTACWINPNALGDTPHSRASRNWLTLLERIESLQNQQAISIHERDALLLRVREVDRLLVDLQNLTAERDALLMRAKEADQQAVTLQNLAAERDALRMMTGEADRLAVDIQNLAAERDALQMRAVEADRLAVALQNLAAERDALLAQVRETERIAVALQNFSAERDALQTRAGEADRLAVELQNLGAERDALLVRASQADRLEVDRQNLEAERNALLLRAREADRLAIDLQNCVAEQDALLARAEEADRLAVDLQNLAAERGALLLRAKEADKLAVDLQNLAVERDALLMRAREADRLAVEIQNLIAERDTLRLQLQGLEQQIARLLDTPIFGRKVSKWLKY